MKFVIAYIPVVHRGVVDFLKECFVEGADGVVLLPRSVTNKFRSLQKDVRALQSEEAAQLLSVFFPDKKVVVLSDDKKQHKRELRQLFGVSGLGKDSGVGSGCGAENGKDVEMTLWLPDEEVTRDYAATIVSNWPQEAQIKWKSTFLRWDGQAAQREVVPETQSVLTKNEFVVVLQNILAQAGGERGGQVLSKLQEYARHSPDWWRQVGAMLVSAEGKVIAVAYNSHVPHEYAVYMAGDPRGNYHKGEMLDRSLALHAEAGVIAAAARQGIPTEDATLYVTTFPCPSCAKLAAAAQIKKLYFRDGYSVVDGSDVLQAAGVEVIQVK